jgi:hypothetical protein
LSGRFPFVSAALGRCHFPLPTGSLMKTRPLAATTLLLVFAIAPLALGQDKAKKPKKGTDTSASASASASAPATTAEAEAAPSAAPSAAESASAAPVPEPPPEANTWDSKNTFEDPKETYYFIGLGYRGTVIPQFLENLFVNDGATAYSNTVSFQLDMRKEGHSTIPWITYTDYSLSPALFLQKNKADDPANYTMVTSSLKGIFLGLDELWSVPLEPTHKVDFEFGFGVGLGFIFGSLINNWVFLSAQNAPGAVKAANGNYYSPCVTMGDAPSCANGSHDNPPPGGKVNQYKEPDWFSGGAVPDVYPRISLQILGVRYKPIKQMEMRLGAGFALTEGFWFQLSGFYGLEKKKEEPIKAELPSIERF